MNQWRKSIHSKIHSSAPKWSVTLKLYKNVQYICVHQRAKFRVNRLTPSEQNRRVTQPEPFRFFVVPIARPIRWKISQEFERKRIQHSAHPSSSGPWPDSLGISVTLTKKMSNEFGAACKWVFDLSSFSDTQSTNPRLQLRNYWAGTQIDELYLSR